MLKPLRHQNNAQQGLRCTLAHTGTDSVSLNSSNVLVKSKIQNENYQINRFKNLKNTE